MPRTIQLFVRAVDAMNRFIGRCAMYLIFVMMGVLLYSSLSKTFFDPSMWTLEVAQFLMVAYFLLGGAYSMQLDEHVRMDLLYSTWSPRTKGIVDAITVLLLIFYLFWLLYGGISSTQYALQYNETSYSAWSPRMAPIKIVMCVGVTMMLLQALATLCRDIAQARGAPLE